MSRKRTTNSSRPAKRPKIVGLAAAARNNKVRKNAPQQTSSMVVTPAKERGLRVQGGPKQSVRRALFSAPPSAVPVTPARPTREENDADCEFPGVKRKLIFGRLVEETLVQPNVRNVYAIVRKLTGSIGGNGSHGPIYGELTMGSMQKMINLMKLHTNFDNSSRFIDVGSGIGKPNLHTAQDPGVEFSYGIEIEFDRWLLGMNCLKGVMDAIRKQQVSKKVLSEEEKILHRCVFERADIRKASVFDPFTHVYMFSIGYVQESPLYCFTPFQRLLTNGLVSQVPAVAVD